MFEEVSEECMSKLAIIGGSGLNAFEGFSVQQEQLVSTPFGEPSSPLFVGMLNDCRLVFMPRHGAGHRIPPHAINYRANIHALKNAGVERIVAVNAVGGIHPEMGPGHVVIPHQLIDYSWGRQHTYFDGSGAVDAESENVFGSVEHVDFTSPYDESLRNTLAGGLRQLNIPHSDFGVYGCTQGPRLETSAEIARLQRDGCDLVGMTGMPEAVLARELGIEYVSICLVVNWAAGISGDAITMDQIRSALEQGMTSVRKLISVCLTGLTD